MTEPCATAPVLFKALTHPVRLSMLDMLRGGERCVCEIEAALGRRQAYVSQQLAVLRDACLVDVRRDGWRVFYRASRPEVFDLIDAARMLTGETGRRRPTVGAVPHAKEGIAC